MAKTSRLIGINQIVSSSGKTYDIGTLPSSGKIRRLVGVDQVVNPDTGFTLDVNTIGYRVFHLSGHGPAPYFFDLGRTSVNSGKFVSGYMWTSTIQNTVQKGSYATGAQATAWCSGDGGGTGYGASYGSNGSIALDGGGTSLEGDKYNPTVLTTYYKTNLVVSENAVSYGSSVLPIRESLHFCDGDNLYTFGTRTSDNDRTKDIQKKSFSSGSGSVSIGEHSINNLFAKSGQSTSCNNETSGFTTGGSTKLYKFSFSGSSNVRTVADLSDITVSAEGSPISTNYGCTTNGAHVMAIARENSSADTSIASVAAKSGVFTKYAADSLSITKPYGNMVGNTANGALWQSLTTDGDDVIVTGGHYMYQTDGTSYYTGSSIVHKKGWNSSSNSFAFGSLLYSRLHSESVTGG